MTWAGTSFPTSPDEIFRKRKWDQTRSFSTTRLRSTGPHHHSRILAIETTLQSTAWSLTLPGPEQVVCQGAGGGRLRFLSGSGRGKAVCRWARHLGQRPAPHSLPRLWTPRAWRAAGPASFPTLCISPLNPHYGPACGRRIRLLHCGPSTSPLKGQRAHLKGETPWDKRPHSRWAR